MPDLGHDPLPGAPVPPDPRGRRRLDEASRPRLARPAAPGEGTAVGRANAQALVQIHDHLRAELEQVRALVEQVAAGQADPAAARSLVNRMTMRQNSWSVGAFCAAYCRVLTVHHAIEDARMFPDLRRADGGLAPVLERLEEEHEVIADVLTGLDEALVATVTDPAGVELLRERVAGLSDALLSHLAYEESELLGPIARLSVVI